MPASCDAGRTFPLDKNGQFYPPFPRFGKSQGENSQEKDDPITNVSFYGLSTPSFRESAIRRGVVRNRHLTASSLDRAFCMSMPLPRTGLKRSPSDLIRSGIVFIVKS